MEDKYEYNRFGSKGKRVGQAVVDILSKDQPVQTVEETLEALSPKYVAELEDTIEKNHSKYKSPFYVFVLTNKEMWAENVVRNWFIARQTAPTKIDMMEQYPNHVKTLYKINYEKGNLQIEWSIPGLQDCLSICKNPQNHHPDLLAWIGSLITEAREREFGLSSTSIL